MSRALDRRIAFSRSRASSVSCSDGGRPDSKAGDAIGESSVEIVNIPSNLRSGNGTVISAEMRASILCGGLASGL